MPRWSPGVLYVPRKLCRPFSQLLRFRFFLHVGALMPCWSRCCCSADCKHTHEKNKKMQIYLKSNMHFPLSLTVHFHFEDLWVDWRVFLIFCVKRLQDSHRMRGFKGGVFCSGELLSLLSSGWKLFQQFPTRKHNSIGSSVSFTTFEPDVQWLRLNLFSWHPRS